MGGKYKIVPVDVLVLAGLYADSLLNYLLFHRLTESFCRCSYSGITMPLRLSDANDVILVGAAYLLI